eukprot:scaffold60632_cov63-Phaeocystis_antarctica.AAC.1
MRPGMAAEALGFEWLEERAVDDFVFMCMLLDSSRIRRPPHSWDRRAGNIYFSCFIPQGAGTFVKTKNSEHGQQLALQLTYSQLVQPYLPPATVNTVCTRRLV